jgi:glycosyltransferase involved in cell wall biosynthesis
MRITVAIVTYRRPHFLKLCLQSLLRQTVFPDEVLIIWKPSPGDYSDRIIKQYEDKLPIRFVIQLKGGFIDALNLAIRLSSGDLTIFIDDDAIAHSQWIERYVKFFNEYPNVGGVSGLTLKAYYKNGNVKLTNHVDWIASAPPLIRSRAPLEEYKNMWFGYRAQVFVGLNKKLITSRSRIILSASLKGANMAWRTKLIRKCPLFVLYISSKKGYGNELILRIGLRKSDTTLISL